jgi:hypothetical protein
MPKDEVSNKKRTEVKTKKDLKQEWETEGKGLGYDTPEEYFNDFYGPLEMNTGGITGAAATREELKRLANTTLKDRSGAAVTTPEFERLKKEADNFKLEYGSKKRQNLSNSIKEKITELESYISKKDSKFDVPGVGVSKPEKKSKGGMTKGQKKIRTVMREFKAKKLKSSSGKKVTNPKQAIAIALSEAGQSKKMKKAKGGAFITKGGDYIKDLL